MFQNWCRLWSYILVRFWSIGYKKRIVLQLAILLIIACGCILVRLSLFANLADFDFIQTNGADRNASSKLWDRWVEKNGYKAIGDIWDSCGKSHWYCINSAIFSRPEKYGLEHVKLSISLLEDAIFSFCARQADFV